MPEIETGTRRLTQAVIHLNYLTHNWRLLQREVGNTALWPVLKANAYGHDAAIVARHLVKLGCRTFCVADVGEAAALADNGVNAKFIVLSATLPEHADALVQKDCEPVVCAMEMVEALAAAAKKARTQLAVHVKVDTGMGRLGIRPEEAPGFVDRCCNFPMLRIRGLMSHFPRADETDLGYSLEQLARFKKVIQATHRHGIEFRQMANSAAIFHLAQSHFDAVRPGIALYGLKPATTVTHPGVLDLKPVLEWKSRIIFLK
ncbi:MAG TPA: alanine racemase [Candidatus Limnocylindria bacterium]|nr:alanine racemase [Candidatus Limnocylindria bacterium]